jgi:hypothetical protein
MEWKVRVNKRSVSGKLAKLEQMAEDYVKQELKKVADSLVEKSPVDTGAYVTSHSFQPTGGRGGRSRSSSNKPRQQNPAEKKQEAKAQLYSDINSAEITSSRAGIFRNRAPHATAVEKKHNVYLYAKDKGR